MGNYNPYAPHILGQEWAPVRDESISFPQDQNVAEYGHGFTLTSSRTLQDGRCYIHEMPTDVEGQTSTIQIYAQGTETLTGPIQRLVIPVEQVLVTGASASSSRSGADILLNPEFTDYYLFNSSSVTYQRLLLSFNTAPYNYLIGKRILAVNLLYGTLISSDPGSVPPEAFLTTIPTGLDANVFGTYLDPSLSSSTPAKRVTVGPYNYYWQSPVTSDFMPWSYFDLERFDSGSSNRMFVQIKWGTLSGIIPTTALYLFYAALEVLFCEERRLVAGILTPPNVAGGGSDLFHYGANIVTLRDITTRATLPTLVPGDYTVTLSQAGEAEYNACRELYAIPGHPSFQMAIPALPEDHIGGQLSATETRVLPQLSLHTSGGPLTEVHAYGRQATAQVWGSVTATQEILDAAALAAASWPHVRFYARRFGQTTVPLLLDSPSIAGSSVQITPADFDALPEIIDGWKEITLRFDTPPTMGAGTNPQWRWSATGELAGNRWEILGAVAPAVSGIGGNLFNLVPSPHQLSNATYGAPSAGSTINLGWIPQYTPPVTATADDQTADAVLIFAQDMAAISGLSVQTGTQDMVGVGLDCDIAPCCVPTAMLYNRITWSLPANTGIADDDFDRVVAAGSWGTASDGHAWTLADLAADYSVNGSEGVIAPSVLNSFRRAWLDVGGPDQDVTVEVRVSDAAESGNLRAAVLTRVTDASNYYFGELRISGAALNVVLTKRVAGVETLLANQNLLSLLPAQTTSRKIRMQVQGTVIRIKVWDSDTSEPWWQIVTTDSSLTTGNNAGLYARDETGAATTSFYFDNFVARPPDFAFGYYELQRSDTVDTDWATIMQATRVAVTGFSDYEARVGITSSYRIRSVDVYDFAGPWSNEVSIHLPSPGASGGCIDQGNILLFSSNERQDGSVNLAYSAAWEANQVVEEGFRFPEADFVQLQAMYNRDFVVAFRPLERGGEQFGRTLLVQAAAISPPTLADFRGLRDMAWDTVSYICVRDQDSNRWLSTVLVPGGRVLRNRRLYLAPVEIIEVTDTPSAVDP